MKNLLTILLFLPLLIQAQMTDTFFIGEYSTLRKHNGLMGSITSNPALGGTGGGGTPCAWNQITTTPSNLHFFDASATIHGWTARDVNYHIWSWGGTGQGENGDGTVNFLTTPVKITTDSFGHPMDSIVMVQGFYVNNTSTGMYAVKRGGVTDTIMGTGDLEYGMAMNGTAGAIATRFYPLYWRTGHHIVKMAASKAYAIVFDDGLLQTGGAAGLYNFLGLPGSGNAYRSPRTVTGMDAGVVDIVGGDVAGFIATTSTGHHWAFGQYSGYLLNAANTAYSTPVDITATLHTYIPGGAKKFTSTAVGWHCLDSLGKYYGWGDAATGFIGNGSGLKLDSAGWVVDPSALLVLPQTFPVLVTNLTVVDCFGGDAFAFSNIFNTSTQTYVSGRNKGGVLGDAVREPVAAGGDQGSNAPDSWDRQDCYPINIDTVTVPIDMNSPYCVLNRSTAWCLAGTYLTTTITPHITGPSTTTSSSITLSDVTSTATGGGKILYHKWKRNSGPGSVVIDNVGSNVINVSGLAIGTHVFQDSLRDNANSKAGLTFTVTVSGIPPTVTPGGPYTITLPTTSQAISVTASGNGGATITGYAWTKTSGPGSTTILNNTTANATATGLQAGTYVFHCVVTDSNGSTTAVDVTVTVNPAPSNCNCKISFPKRIIPH